STPNLPVAKTTSTGHTIQQSQLSPGKKHAVRSGRRHRRARVRPAVGNGRHRARLRPIRIPYTPLKGSRESLLRQNERNDELERIQDDDQLWAIIGQKDLVELPVNDDVTVAPNLPSERRYCRSWTRTFLEDLGAEYGNQFNSPLVVTSAVRTAEVQ